jgi:amino acid transporter
VIYIVTALVITGIVNYKEFEGVTDPLAYVFEKIGMRHIGFIISVSAVVAATSVMLVFQLGQPRIWMSMSRDGLLPASFGTIHKKFKTPAFATIVSGALVAVLVLFVDDRLMTDLTSIGTLFAFVLVSGGVLLLPRIAKEPGKFSLPYINGKWIIPFLFLSFIWVFSDRTQNAFLNIQNESHQEILFVLFIIISAILSVFSFTRNYSLIPVLGVMCCMYLMIEIPAKSWLVFFGWMAAGLMVYFLYGNRKSRLVKGNERVL